VFVEIIQILSESDFDVIKLFDNELSLVQGIDMRVVIKLRNLQQVFSQAPNFYLYIKWL